MTKEIKLRFLPGCFDSFDGDQEELDALVAQVTAMFQSEEFTGAEIVMLNEDDLTPEEWAILDEQDEIHMPAKRILQ